MSRALRPFEPITAAATAARLHREPARVPVPVLCCGNVVVGGAGKTTLALDLLGRLSARGVRVHALTRGYGGRATRAARRVEPGRHDAASVGDEALLLAGEAPCWVGVDRAASAAAAVRAGAAVLVMDDGLQNGTLHQDWPILVVDGAVGFGNGRLLPAGPLREPIAVAAGRAAAAVIIGEERVPIAPFLPPALPRLAAELVMDPALAALRDRRLVAFAGIGRPAKFFDALSGLGLDLAATRGFPDHHRFRGRDLVALETLAARHGARLVTTPKDAVRLPASFRERVVVARPGLRWHDPAALDALLGRVIERTC